MNSDFMQQQAELLARRIEPNRTRARIGKAYTVIFGRAPTDAEVNAGLDYLATEPMKAYEERKAEREKAAAKEKADPTKGGTAADESKGRPSTPPTA